MRLPPTIWCVEISTQGTGTGSFCIQAVQRLLCCRLLISFPCSYCLTGCPGSSWLRWYIMLLLDIMHRTHCPLSVICPWGSRHEPLNVIMSGCHCAVFPCLPQDNSWVHFWVRNGGRDAVCVFDCHLRMYETWIEIEVCGEWRKIVHEEGEIKREKMLTDTLTNKSWL